MITPIIIIILALLASIGPLLLLILNRAQTREIRVVFKVVTVNPDGSLSSALMRGPEEITYIRGKWMKRKDMLVFSDLMWALTFMGDDPDLQVYRAVAIAPHYPRFPRRVVTPFGTLLSASDMDWPNGTLATSKLKLLGKASV